MRAGEPLTATITTRLPVDLALTLWPLRRGWGDPTIRAELDGSWWRATRTSGGPATTRFEPDGGGILVEAWGPGADRALDEAPALLGGGDVLEGFDPPRGIVRELHRRMPGLRITRSGAVLEALVPSILEQKVAGKLARASYRSLVLAEGEPAPGPARLRLPPSAGRLAAMRYDQFHRFGVEMRRANVIRNAAASNRLLERAARGPLEDAYRCLRSLPGVGAWTAAEVAIVALGDPDAVPLGDFHLPNQVAWVLAREPRGDDERMLELLAPFAGHRGRVIRLIGAAGLSPPRFGPRAPLASPSRI
jgi:hypothetical protein